MTKRQNRVLWIAMIVSFPASLYAAGNAVTYAWLNAASPGRWPAQTTAPWFYGWMSVSVVLFGLSVFCIVSLIKEANRRYRQEQGTE